MPRKLKKDKWFTPFKEEPDLQFLLKPFSLLYLKRVPSDESSNIEPESMWDVFNAVVVDWKGLEADDGKPMKCNEGNKRKIVEQFNDILVAVFTESISQFNKSGIVPKDQAKN